jgi:peroxiredoxin Q/BCP
VDAQRKERQVSEQGLKVGDPAPDFALPDERGEIVRLADFRGHRVVLYFYPMDDTPGCTLQACAFRDALPEIEERNAVVLGISPDDGASHQAFKTKYNLPFTLLVDADHVVARAYGAWQEGSSYVTRSQFLIDEAGRLLDIQVPVRATESLRLALESLGGEPAS